MELEAYRFCLNDPNEYIHEKNWFEKLPNLFQHKVLKALDHKSLIYFANAYKNYRKTCLNPIYWRTLKNWFDPRFVTIEEIMTIIQYLNENLEFLQLDLAKFNLEKTKYTYEEIFSPITNMSHLEIYHFGNCNLVQILCDKLKFLRVLRIDWPMIGNYHLFKIADSFTYLDSFMLTTAQKVDEGLDYMIDKVKRFDQFGFRVDSLNDK